MCDYGADPPSFLLDEYRKARKEHWCYECGARIAPGTRYVHTSGKWDDRIDTHAAHVVCFELNKRIGDELCGGTYTYGGLFESIREHYDETRGDLNARETCRMIVRGFAAVRRQQARAS